MCLNGLQSDDFTFILEKYFLALLLGEYCSLSPLPYNFCGGPLFEPKATVAFKLNRLTTSGEEIKIQ
jgi:hypothetical protein